MKTKYKLKQGKGVLHIGGGRFYHPSEPYELDEAVIGSHGHYFDVIDDEEPDNQAPPAADQAPGQQVEAPVGEQEAAQETEPSLPSNEGELAAQKSRKSTTKQVE